MEAEDLTPDIAYVYELVWPGTNEIYIGSTSQTPEERFKGHKNQPRACYAHLGIENAKLGFCFDYKPKHNWDRTIEARWKRLSNALGHKVLDDGDQHNMPLRQPEEFRQKVSEAMNRPEVILKQRQAQGKPFTVTWPSGRSKGYWSLSEARADLGVNHRTIEGYLKGRTTPGKRSESAHLKGCTFTYTNTP